MKLTQWHAQLIKRQQARFGWSDDELVWFADSKGIVTGLLLYWCWLLWM